MSTTFRSDRAAEAVREAVARIITGEVQDPRLRLVTITSCEMSRDLQHARIFYTVLGDQEAQEKAQAGFISATPFLRSRVGQEVPMRTVPELSFRFDRSTENAMRIEELLSGLPELQKDKDEQGSTPS
ncbi:MAG TPA: 30S ribosome-binding factor RbfA [Abditibacteriaceae bacterium]|nr:30S ribosome-binding factor RbfA [Abditibacteriaceae bacterium]